MQEYKLTSLSLDYTNNSYFCEGCIFENKNSEDKILFSCLLPANLNIPTGLAATYCHSVLVHSLTHCPIEPEEIVNYWRNQYE